MAYANAFEEMMSGMRSAGAPGSASSYGYHPAAAEAYSRQREMQRRSFDPVYAQQMALQERPAAPQQSWLDKLYNDYTTAHQKALEDNQKRFGIAAGLLGMDDDGNLMPGVAGSGAAAMPIGGGFGSGSITHGGGGAPTWSGASPAGAKVDAEMAKRGVYNVGSSVLNKFNAATKEKFDADMGTWRANQDAYQIQLAQQERDLGRLERLRGERVDLWTAPTTKYPDPALLAKLAEAHGQGDQGGLGAPVGGGGGGWVSPQSMGYQMPFVGLNYPQQRQATRPSVAPKLSPYGEQQRNAQENLAHYRRFGQQMIPPINPANVRQLPAAAMPRFPNVGMMADGYASPPFASGWRV